MYEKNRDSLPSKRHVFGLLIFSAGCCFATGIMSIPAAASSQSSAPIEAQVSVEGNKTLSLGEPLALLYKVTNVSDRQGVGIGLGNYKTEWCQFSLTDAEGRQVQVIPEQRPSEPRGLHSTGTFFLQPNAYEEDRLVLTQRLKITHPGKYTLVVQVNIPYATEEATEEAHLSANLADDVKSSNTALRERFVFPITITKVDAPRLADQANTLKRMVMVEKDSKKKQALLDALFSMPEAQAGASWKDLIASASGGDSMLLADHLARLYSTAGVELLVHMLDKPDLSLGDVSFIQGKIAENYNAGDTALRERVKALAADCGTVMPEKVLVPQVTD